MTIKKVSMMKEETTHAISLDGEWRLRAIGKSPKAIELSESIIKANVPGTVHTDLMSAGVIPDPFYRDNESKVQWVEDTDWEYSREFELSQEDALFPGIYLTFEGIDTVADVFLNNKRVLHAQNMFVTHRVRVDRFIRIGTNSVRVVIHSPKAFAIRREKKYGRIFAELDSYRVHIRKAQYSFGWDWGPRLATSGIWRNVHLDFVKDVFVEDVHLSTLEIRQGKVKALFMGKFQSVSGAGLRGRQVRVSVFNDKRSQDFVFPIGPSVKKELSLSGIEAWWTHDFGDPELYGVKVEVLDRNDDDVSTRNFRTGFRTIRLLREGDRIGESFIFELNGRRIFIKGADWIPSDSFLPRVDDYRVLVKAACDANMNMLRVWGGGVYEDERFYNACDENGILVWQDFMFACAFYPEYDAFLGEVEAEATENVGRISNHPCVAVFCGNNESEWIWQTKTGRPVDEMPGAAIFDKKLRQIVKKVSPEISYWRSSPFGGRNPNSQSEGNHHQWEVWSAFKSPAEYRKNTARFVTEFGFQAPPSLATIDSFTEPMDCDMQSKIIRLHNKQIEGTERLYRFLSGEVKMAKDFKDVVSQMQLVQAKATKTGVEHWRTRKWKTAGTIFWQLNDCWPVSSWSAVDYHKRPKALYYWAKNFYKPVKLVIEDEADHARVYLVNDTMETISGELITSVMDVRGNILMNSTKKIFMRANSVASLDKFPMSEFRKEDVFVHAHVVVNSSTGKTVDEEEHILVPWLDFRFEMPHVQVHVKEEKESMLVQLKSDRFIQGVFLPLNEKVGELSDNFFSLVPNVEKFVRYSGTRTLDRLQVRFPLIADLKLG